jgi:hypothetical protein
LTLLSKRKVKTVPGKWKSLKRTGRRKALPQTKKG